MLYDLLTSRPAINILKKLSDKDKDKKYAIKIRELAGDYKKAEEAVKLLSERGLVYVEDGLLSISEKGKKFIDIFDQLVDLSSQKEKKRETNVEIRYDLSDFEKKTLFMLLRLQQETNRPVSLTTLSRELFPYENYEQKKTRVSRQLNKLEHLNLVRKIKKREVMAEVTDTGTKVVKRQLVTEISRIA